MTNLVEPDGRNTFTSDVPADGEPRTGLLCRIRRAWVRLVAPARYDRLEGALRVAEADIERRFDPNAPCLPVPPVPGELLPDAPWKPSARWLLSQARTALEGGQVDQGWKCLHAARRLEIFGMDKSRELPTYAAALLAEAEKLKSWRQLSVRGILDTVEKQRTVSAPGIAYAAFLRDEHYDNQAYKDQLIRTQILFLAAILAVVMAGIMGMLYAGVLPLEPEPPVFFTFLGVMLFGNLGGTISAMLRASDSMASARIPEITSANRVTLMRILMGGASAILIYLALRSQLIGIFNKEVVDTLTGLTPPTFYVVAFVSGFTERLVLRAVEYVAGKEKATEPGQAKAPKP